MGPQWEPIRMEYETTWLQGGPIRMKWAEPTYGPTVGMRGVTGELWAHHGETVGKWNEIDNQMQKHTHKVTSITANDYINVNAG